MTNASEAFGQVPDWLGPVRSDGVRNALRQCRDAGIASAFRSAMATLHSSAPELASMSGCTAAGEVLGGLRWSSVQPILSHPSFEKWVIGVRGFIARDAHLKLPHGQLVSYLGSLASFSLAGLLRQQQQASIDVPVDANGRLHLRGLGRFVQLPLDYSGSRIRCRAEPDGTVGLAAPLKEPLKEPARSRVVELPRTGNGWELNWADPVLSRANPVPWPDGGQLPATVGRAWRLAELAVPAYAAEIAETMRAVVPASAETDSVDRPCLGLWEARLGPTLLDVATGLLVRSQQAKVRVVLRGLVDPATRRREHGRYWPRIERLLMDAVAAHATTTFCRGCSNGSGELADAQALDDRRRQAEQRFAAVSAALDQEQWLPPLVERMWTFWRDDLGDSPSWTPAPAPVAAAPVAAGDDFETSDDIVDRFVSKWLAAGGQRGQPSPIERLLVPRSLDAVAELVGITDGIPINRAYSGIDRADPILDRLGLAWVTDPAWFQNVRRQVDDLPTTGDPLERMLRGHLDYIDGKADLAAEHYAVAAMAAPPNLDCWHDLSFALLHTGRPEARVFLFAPDLFVRLADSVLLDDTAALLPFMRAVDRFLELGVT